jgi:high-affinity iron transporter
VLEPGFLVTGLLTGLREGVEAALIVAIILSYLVRTGNGRHVGRIGLGVLAAVLASAVVGAALWLTVGGLPSPYEQVFEGLAMLLAAAVVTWMLFWMRRQAASVRGDLQSRVDRALTEGGAWALAALAFTAVAREGIETSIFLVGLSTSAGSGSGSGSGTDLGAGAGSGASSVLVGALIGLLIAVGLGYGFYRGARLIDLRRFFKWTGVALVFIAAGLLSRAVHEFVEIGVIGLGTGTAFDISTVLPHEEGVGQFLRAIFGYTSQPEWVTLVSWTGYVVAVLWLYLRPMPPRPPLPAEVPQPVGG